MAEEPRKPQDLKSDASRPDLTLEDHHKDLTRKFKLIKERHQSQLNELNLLDRILHISGDPHDFDKLAEAYMDVTMDSLDVESGALYFYDGAQDELYFAAARGPRAQAVLQLDITFKPGVGLVGCCFQDAQVIANSDLGHDDRFFKEVSESVDYLVRSILTVPVVHRGHALGVLQVLNKNDSDEFSPEEVEWLTRLGRYAGYSFALFLELQLASQATTEAKS